VRKQVNKPELKVEEESKTQRRKKRNTEGETIPGTSDKKAKM